MRLIGRSVFVQRHEEVEVTRGGLILPREARERPQSGKVVALGAFRGGTPLHEISVGSEVIFPKFWDRTLWVAPWGEVLWFRDSDLLAVIED